MTAQALIASVKNQHAAQQWYSKARDWGHLAATHGSEIVASAAADFARRDQEDAARLSRADRRLRGLEG